jgi:hypothetical protein
MNLLECMFTAESAENAEIFLPVYPVSPFFSASSAICGETGFIF